MSIFTLRVRVPQAGLSVYILLFLFVSQLLCGACGYSAEGDSDNMGHPDAAKVVVARVNGVELNMAMLMSKMYEVAKSKYGKREISPLVATKVKEDALNGLITEELAYQKAHAVVGDVSKMQIDKAVEQLKGNYGGKEKFEAYLQKSHTTLEDYRHQVARTLTVKLFIKREIDAKIKISDDDITAAYKGAKDKYFIQHEQVQVTDITLFFDANSKAGVAKANDFRKKIINEFGNDPFKMTKDATFALMKDETLNPVTSKELYDAAKKLGDHGISPPINVAGTLHLVQLTGYKPDITKTLAEARSYLKRELTKRKRQVMIKNWVLGLKKGAKIEIIDMDA